MELTPESEEQRLRENHRKRLARLAADKRKIFAMDPESALDAILEHPMNTALIHSMAEEDFFFLINDIGHHDALEILSLASNRQWEYILDIDGWHRDRMQLDSVAYWMNLMHRADPGRFIRWSTTEKYDILEYLINQKATIVVREPDEDPGDIGDGFFTCDDVFYIRFADDAFASFEDEDDREEIEEFVYTMIRRIADEDHGAYQMMLLRAASVIPGECEEEAYRFRNVRLAEKGFLPFEEAVGVYAPVKPSSIRKKHRIRETGDASGDFSMPVPVNHRAMLDHDTLFGRAIASSLLQASMDDVQIEFASLCNRIIAADQRPMREKESLREMVRKACGYLEIGIHRLAGTKHPPGTEHAAAIIRDHALEDIFRTGYALVLDLQRKAVRWKKQGWFTRNQLALSFWGERLVGQIGGLLLKHPKYFDNYRNGLLYREFSSMADLRSAKKALDEAAVMDSLFSSMGIDTRTFPEDRFVTASNCLLTLWANSRLAEKQPAGPEPIPVAAFRAFYRTLWEPAGNTRRIREAAKTDFLEWLSNQSGREAPDVSQSASEYLENLFATIEGELAGVAEEHIDYRYVEIFLLKP